MFLSDITYQQEAESALTAYFGADRQPVSPIIAVGLAGNCRFEIEMTALSAQGMTRKSEIGFSEDIMRRK